MLETMIRVGWGKPNAAFRRLFTTLFVPDGTPAQMEWFDELMRTSTLPETAMRIWDARAQLDVTARAPELEVPASVMHARDDAVVPFAEGRLIAGLIEGAQSCRWKAATTCCSKVSRRGRTSSASSMASSAERPCRRATGTSPPARRRSS